MNLAVQPSAHKQVESSYSAFTRQLPALTRASKSTLSPIEYLIPRPNTPVVSDDSIPNSKQYYTIRNTLTGVLLPNGSATAPNFDTQSSIVESTAQWGRRFKFARLPTGTRSKMELRSHLLSVSNNDSYLVPHLDKWRCQCQRWRPPCCSTPPSLVSTPSIYFVVSAYYHAPKSFRRLRQKGMFAEVVLFSLTFVVAQASAQEASLKFIWAFKNPVRFL